MGNQIGIPEYKEFINAEKLSELKKSVNGLCLNFAGIASTDAINNRESDKFELYSKQYNSDLMKFQNMIYYAQTIVNEINNIMLNISTNAIQQKFYEE